MNETTRTRKHNFNLSLALNLFILLSLCTFSASGQQVSNQVHKQPEYIRTKSLNGLDKIQILRETDIHNLETGVTWNELLDRFGEPFPSTVTMLTWPKERSNLKSTSDDRDSLWVNGYWFIFRDYQHDGGKTTLLIVASFDKKTQLQQNESIPIEKMSINWPPELQGQNAGEYLHKWMESKK